MNLYRLIRTKPSNQLRFTRRQALHAGGIGIAAVMGAVISSPAEASDVNGVVRPTLPAPVAKSSNFRRRARGLTQRPADPVPVRERGRGRRAQQQLTEEQLTGQQLTAQRAARKATTETGGADFVRGAAEYARSIGSWKTTSSGSAAEADRRRTAWPISEWRG